MSKKAVAAQRDPNEVPETAEQAAERLGLHQETWTYVGRVILEGGGLGYTWLDANRKERAYSKFHPTGCQPGARYSVYCNDTSAMLTGLLGPRFVDRDADDDRIVEWIASDRAVYSAFQARREEKNANAKNPYKARLEPIRRAFLMAHTQIERRAILTDVIEAIAGRAEL